MCPGLVPGYRMVELPKRKRKNQFSTRYIEISMRCPDTAVEEHRVQKARTKGQT